MILGEKNTKEPGIVLYNFTGKSTLGTLAGSAFFLLKKEENMRYYISEVTRYKEPVNDKMEKFSMNGRDTENEALIVYHEKMAAARKDSNTAIEVIHVMDEKGGEIVTDCYEDIPAPEPEPEPEPEEEPKVEG